MIPHLYVHFVLNPKDSVPLSSPQLHYLTKVMRLKAGQRVHIFNGTQGLWRAEFHDQHLSNLSLLLPQPPAESPIGLFFSPIKAQNWLIEKSVEVGVTDFFPTLCHRTVVRHFCPARHTKIVHEACEQSRRWNIPKIHPLVPLSEHIKNPPLNFLDSMGVLRIDAPTPFGSSVPSAVFIGPEGGWSPEEEMVFSQAPWIKPLHLGQGVLRAETAAVVAATLMRYTPTAISVPTPL